MPHLFMSQKTNHFDTLQFPTLNDRFRDSWEVGREKTSEAQFSPLFCKYPTKWAGLALQRKHLPSW